MKNVMFVIDASSYDINGNAARVVGDYLTKKDKSCNVSYVTAMTPKLKEKIANHLSLGGFIVSINACGILEKNIHDQSVWGEYGKQISIWFTKAPWIYSEELRELKWIDTFFATDKSFAAYVEEKLEKKCEIVPIPIYDALPRKKNIRRQETVFFAGSYLNPGDMKNRIEELVPTILEPYFAELITRCKKQSGYDLVEEMKAVFRTKGEGSEKLALALAEEYGFVVQEYISRRVRYDLLYVLLENDMKVAVCGQNWEIFIEGLPESLKKNITHVGMTSSIKHLITEAMNYKVLLDITTNYRSSMHERVAIGRIAGCNVVAMENETTKDRNSKHFITYQSKDRKRFVTKVKKALETDIPDRITGVEEYCAEYFASKLREHI